MVTYNWELIYMKSLIREVLLECLTVLLALVAVMFLFTYLFSPEDLKGFKWVGDLRGAGLAIAVLLAVRIQRIVRKHRRVGTDHTES